MSEVHLVNGLSERMSFGGEIPENIESLNLSQGLTILESKEIDFTMQKAEELLRLPEFIVGGEAVDRNLGDAHVTRLLTAMKERCFRWEQVAIITCICDEKNGGRPKGSEYRMNGQHTAHARIYYGEVEPLRVRYLRYQAKTLEDMRALYATIDAGRARTFKDKVNALLVGTPVFAGVCRTAVKNIASGYIFWQNGGDGSRSITVEAVVSVFKTGQLKHLDATSKFLNAALKSDRMGKLIFRRAQVAGAVLWTFDTAPQKAQQFWQPVLDGIGDKEVLERGDPRLKLRDFLLTSAVKKGRTERRIVTTEEMFRICINCWNAWRAGRLLPGTPRADMKADRPQPK